MFRLLRSNQTAAYARLSSSLYADGMADDRRAGAGDHGPG